jgi:hypothetical protein
MYLLCFYVISLMHVIVLGIMYLFYLPPSSRAAVFLFLFETCAAVFG